MVIKFIRIWYPFFIVVICVVLFFLSYNTYLVDHSLENLRFALNEMSTQRLPADVKELGMILEYAMMDELTSKKLDSVKLAKLEISHAVLTKGQTTGQLKDATAFFKDVIAEKERKRGVFLLALDRINEKVSVIATRLFRPAKYEVGKILGARVNLALLETAKSLENKGEFLEAMQTYSEFIKRYPEYEKINTIRLRQSYCYRRLGRYQEAREIYQDLIKTSPDSFEGKLAKVAVVKLEQITKLGSEKDILEQKIPTLISKTDLQEAYNQLGLIYMQQMDFNKTMAAFQKAINIDPQSPLIVKIKFNMARIFKFQQKWEDSITAFKEIIKEYPETDLAKDASFQIADILSRQEKYKGAIDEFSKVATELKDKPIGALAQFQVGSIYLYELKDTQKAKESFNKLTETYPVTTISEYTKEKIKDMTKEHFIEGFKNLLEKHYDTAKEEFDKALEIDSGSAISFAGRGTLYAKLERKDSALSDCQRAVEIDPQSSYTHGALGYAYATFGEYDNAIFEYKKSLELDPKNTEVRYNLACAYELKGELEVAKQEYKSVLGIRPDYPEAHCNLGRVFWSQGQYDDAIKEYKIAIDLIPEYIEAHYNLGLAYRHQNKYIEAERQFKKVLELNPDFKDTKMHLRDLASYLKEGKK